MWGDVGRCGEIRVAMNEFEADDRDLDIVPEVGQVCSPPLLAILEHLVGHVGDRREREQHNARHRGRLPGAVVPARARCNRKQSGAIRSNHEQSEAARSRRVCEGMRRRTRRWMRRRARSAADEEAGSPAAAERRRCGRPWKAVEGCERLWNAMEGQGRWQAVAGRATSRRCGSNGGVRDDGPRAQSGAIRSNQRRRTR